MFKLTIKFIQTLFSQVRFDNFYTPSTIVCEENSFLFNIVLHETESTAFHSNGGKLKYVFEQSNLTNGDWGAGKPIIFMGLYSDH